MNKPLNIKQLLIFSATLIPITMFLGCTRDNEPGMAESIPLLFYSDRDGDNEIFTMNGTAAMTVSISTVNGGQPGRLQ